MLKINLSQPSGFYVNNFRAAAYKYINNNFIVVVVVGAVDMWICRSKPDYYWIFLWDNSVKTGWIVKG